MNKVKNENIINFLMKEGFDKGYHKIDGPPRLKRRGLSQALDFGDVQN